MSTQECTISCKLGTREFILHKTTLLGNLKKQITNTVETENGFCFYFIYSEASLQIIIDFIKAEKDCCPFFEFSLKIKETIIALELTGPDGVKAFIKDEMQLV